MPLFLCYEELRQPEDADVIAEIKRSTEVELGFDDIMDRTCQIRGCYHSRSWLYSGFFPRLIFLLRQLKHGLENRSLVARICVWCKHETARFPRTRILKVCAIPPATPVGISRLERHFLWK